MENREQRFRRRVSKRRENIIGGILLLCIGGVLLARQAGAELPPWLFTWPMIPIIVGLFVGAKTQFKDFGWLILVGVGVFFLVDRIQGISMKEYFFPGVIIIAGLIVLFGAIFRRSRTNPEDDSTIVPHSDPGHVNASSDDVIEVVSVFGSTKRLVLSKNFRGGEIVSVFGSAEINLTNADFSGKLVLEVVQIFGGTKLIIPPHWVVQTKTAAILGGIEDKRSFQNPIVADPEKVLVLEGATIFGGVTIASY